MKRFACNLIGHRWWCMNASYPSTSAGCKALFGCKRCGRKTRAIYNERYEVVDLPKPSRWIRLPAPGRFYPSP